MSTANEVSIMNSRQTTNVPSGRGFSDDASSGSSAHHGASLGRETPASVEQSSDPLDQAVPLTGHAAPEPDDPDHSDEVINEEERNATGGALPATDDEDNDNDNDDARERDIPDHLVKDEDE
jgi:hypothetical protein